MSAIWCKHSGNWVLIPGDEHRLEFGLDRLAESPWPKPEPEKNWLRRLSRRVTGRRLLERFNPPTWTFTWIRL